MNIKKILINLIKIMRYIALAVSVFLMVLAVFIAVLYFFVPKTYGVVTFVETNHYLESILFGEFKYFLQITSLIFFAGIAEYLFSRFLARFAFSLRSEL